MEDDSQPDFGNLCNPEAGQIEPVYFAKVKKSLIQLENPRSTILERVRAKLELPLDTELRATPGEAIDLQTIEKKGHIPNTRCFSHVLFTNPATGRLGSVFTCDHKQCGKMFRKWHNLFDHLRVHTNEKPFPCPKDGCHKRFNQVSNQKKHLGTHRGKAIITCSGC